MLLIWISSGHFKCLHCLPIQQLKLNVTVWQIMWIILHRYLSHLNRTVSTSAPLYEDSVSANKSLSTNSSVNKSSSVPSKWRFKNYLFLKWPGKKNNKINIRSNIPSHITVYLKRFPCTGLGQHAIFLKIMAIKP